MTTNEFGLPPTLEDVPPTAVLVYKYLCEHDTPVSVAALAQGCRRSPRAVRYALVDLDEAGLVERVSDVADAGTPKWRLTGDVS